MKFGNFKSVILIAMMATASATFAAEVETLKNLDNVRLNVLEVNITSLCNMQNPQACKSSEDGQIEVSEQTPKNLEEQIEKLKEATAKRDEAVKARAELKQNLQSGKVNMRAYNELSAKLDSEIYQQEAWVYTHKMSWAASPYIYQDSSYVHQGTPSYWGYYLVGDANNPSFATAYQKGHENFLLSLRLQYHRDMGLNLILNTIKYRRTSGGEDFAYGAESYVMTCKQVNQFNTLLGFKTFKEETFLDCKLPKGLGSIRFAVDTTKAHTR